MILLALLAMFVFIIGSIGVLLALVIAPMWYQHRARRNRRLARARHRLGQ